MTMNNDFLQNMLAHPLKATVAYYATCLVACAKAVAYLARNCLASDATLQVGFADRTLGTHLPSNMVKAGKEIRSKLESVGIYRPNGREHFRGFVTVPLSNMDGGVTGIYGRRIDRNGDGPVELTIGVGIFNSQALRSYEEVIVTDNVLDAWTFYSAGHTNVVYGATDVADFKLVKRVLLTSDTIDCEAFGGCEIYRVKFPVGQSAHAYLLAQRDSQADPLGAAIRAAGWESRTIVPIVQGAAEAPAEVNGTVKLGGILNAKEATIETIVRHSLASPIPIKLDDLQVTMTAEDIIITTEWRRYRIRGLERNVLPGVMKVNLLIYNERTDRFHVDNFDLYHARSRRTFTMEAADEIGASESQLRSDLGRVLLKLEQLQTEQKQLSKKSNAGHKGLSDNDRREALKFLQSENLLDRILDDFEACGIVGERTAKLTGYLAATSRLLPKPLGIILQSSSAAGKSTLAEAVLRFMPEESRFACSAMTSQSLYYLGREDLKHKILSISEQEGVRDASYQLKLLQSEGHLSLVATGKETGTGRTNTERYEVEGPVALIMTTTSQSIDPELLNRCLVVAVDESVAQTVAIQSRQRFNETMEGHLHQMQSPAIVERHRNAQRLLRPLPVFNPYASQLSFVGWQTRHRRDQGKYLSLIKAITLLHQHQREVRQISELGEVKEYLQVTRRDIAAVNQIADWALGRSIDELAEPARRLLIALYDWTRTEAQSNQIPIGDVRFTRRAVRETLGWGSTQLAYHLERLVRDEYAVRTGGSIGKLCQYKLVYDGRGREGQPHLLHLTDPATLVEPAESAPTKTDLSA
jgi:DNA primase